MMIKKTAKRALSVVLSMVLIATTFFIFDPSVFKIDTGAYVNIESNASTSSLSSQEAYAPETIYLKPGSATFNYFCNYNSKTVAISEPKSTSSYIYFKNLDATEVTLAVNKVYYKNGSTEVSHSGALKINSTTVSAYAGCSATSTNFANSPTAVASGTNTINYQVTTGSLAGCAQNTTYFIEWVVRYKIEGTYHLMFMYTGVYCPSINMTGVASRSRYTGTGNTPELNSIAFITGAMKYAQKGNRYHAFTNTSYRAWGGTTGAGARTAPLIGFVGYKNDSTNNTVPNDDWNSENNFPTSSTGTGLTMLVAGGEVNKENPRYYTEFTNYGTYANPNPSGTISGDCNASGYQTGVAYTVVDTSRYTNYNQIPYLSAGFITTFKKSGSYKSVLEYIRATNATLGDLGTSIYCSNDTGDHNDHDEHQTRTFGLYALNGPIYNGGFQLAFHALQGVDFGVGHRTMNVTQAVGLHTTTVNKSSLRTTYNKALHSNIDLVNVNASKSVLGSMDYSAYYSQMKASGEALCDPTAYSKSSNSTLDGYISSWSKAISNALDTSVYFYVPETIYLNPIASNGQYRFQYYVDRANTANGGLTANGGDTTGDIYFKSTLASRVTSISASMDGGSISIGTTSYNGNEFSTTMNGYSTTYSNKVITWTCKYIDKVSGKEMTATAYTYVYAPVTSSTISATSSERYKGAWNHDKSCSCVTGWIVGAHSIDCSYYTLSSASSGSASYSGDAPDASGTYKYNYLASPNASVPTVGHTSVAVYDSGTGGSGYYKSDADSDWWNGGKGTIYIDSSRYTNLNQIPNLYLGLDSNYVVKGSAKIRLFYGFYSKVGDVALAEDDSMKANVTRAASQDGATTGSTHRGIRPSQEFSARTTATDTLVVMAQSRHDGSYRNRRARASCFLVCNFRDKTILREAYELMMKNSTYLQQVYFTDAAWNEFTSYRAYVYNHLCNPASSASQGDLENFGKALYNQVSKMVACVKADAGSTAASYNTYGTTATTSVNRSDVLKTGTAKVYHRYINGGSGSSTTTAALNAAVNGTTNVETKTYYYGETVSTGYNDTKGYSYFGYFRNEGTTEWTSPSNGDLIANAPGPNKYGSSGDNSDVLVAVPNLTYTYVYHKQDLSVCKDYGDSIQNFGAVQNLANLSAASFNASYGNWGASGGTATISGTSATGFSFAVTNVGSYSGGSLRFNDIYIANAATGLTAGGTYTIAFKSDLDYDDMAWYGDEFNSASGWNQYSDYLYTPGSMALYVLTTSQGTKALQKVDTSYSTGGTVASFTLPSGTTAVNLILRIFSDGTEKYDGTITDFKIAEGQYVYEGVEGDSVTFDTPTRIGYTFQGWIEGSSPFDGTLSGTLNTTYTFGCGNDVVLANWKANTYIVTFDPNSGSCSLASKSVIFDDEYGALPQPEKTGYTNTGWYTQREGGDKITTTTIVKTPNDHTLYAQWQPNTYTVYFNANGGSVSPASKVVTYDSTYGTLPVPTRAGYTFNGWFTAASGGTEVTASTAVKITGQQTLYAHWTANTYTVTFNANGGSCSTASKTVTFDSAYGDLPTATRTGYTFAGWYTAETSGTKVETSTVVKTASNHTLYAHWSANTYTVYFNANTGVCDTASKTVTYDSAYGTLPTPTKTGYTFNGWFTATSGGSKVEKTTVVKMVGNHTLYAQWTANNYKVTFNANGGTVSPASKTVTYDSTYGDLPTATRTGYTFNGWFTATSGGTQVTSSMAVKTASDHTLYAQWTANKYTVTFDAAGGNVSPASKTVTFDSAYGELPVPTREGYTFDGWFTAASGGTQIFAVTVVSTAKDHTLYAHWTANTYTVTFNANAGSCATPSKTVTFDSPYGELPTPVRTGYTSEGWYTAELGGELIKATTTVKTASDHTLYAHWAANKYTVTFDPNGGKCTPTSKKVTYYEAYGELPTATRDGYTFDGWFTAKDGGEKIEPTTIYTLSDVQTLYAHWTVNNYTVTFDPTGGECDTVSKVVTFDAEYGALPTASRTGYAFEAWYTAKNGGTLIEGATIVETASDHTLYAHWIANKYTVTLDANSGDCETPAIIVNFGSPYGALPTATKSCYTFVGWYTQAEGGNLVTQSTIVNTLSDHTIYAHWVLAGHDYVDEVFEPTCLEDGYTVHTCSRCGDTYTDSIIPKGPDYHKWVYVSSDSTTHTYECEICHERKTEEHKEDMDGNCICDDGYKDGAYEVDIAFGGKVICFKYMPVTELFDSSNFSVPVKYRASKYRVGHKTVLTPRADYKTPKNGDVMTYDADFEYTDYAGGRFDVTVVDKGVTTVTSYGWEEKATIRSSWANFLYWVDEYGNIVSTYKVYYFLTVKDTTLTAVYKSDVSDPSAEKAFIKTNFAENGDDDSLTFYSERCVNYINYTLLSHGLIVAPSSKVGNDYNTLYNSLVCNSGNSNILVYDKAVPEGQSTAKCYGMFTVAIPQKYLKAHSLDNEVWYARAYILVENKTTGEIEYHYGDIAEFDLSDPNATFTRRTDVKNDNLLIATV